MPRNFELMLRQVERWRARQFVAERDPSNQDGYD
jgi:hypothetical protein